MRNPLRGLPGRLVEPLGVLEDLGGLVDVLVGHQMVEQGLPPVVARLEDLPGQFLDDALDRAEIDRLGDRRQHPVQAGHAVAVRGRWGDTAAAATPG